MGISTASCMIMPSTIFASGQCISIGYMSLCRHTGRAPSFLDPPSRPSKRIPPEMVFVKANAFHITQWFNYIHPCSAYSANRLRGPAAKRRSLNCENETYYDGDAQQMKAVSRSDKFPSNTSSLNEGHGQFAGGNNHCGNTTIGDQARAMIGDQYGTHNHFYGRDPSNAEPATSADRLKLLVASSTFKRMDARLHNIATALPKTCTWLFRHPAFQSNGLMT